MGASVLWVSVPPWLPWNLFLFLDTGFGPTLGLVPFEYYDRLSKRNQAIYRKSDAIVEIPLLDPALLHPFVGLLKQALERDDRRAVEGASAHLCLGTTEMLDAPPVAVKVLAVRPSRSWGELHGLYTNEEDAKPEIRVWMRTARKKRVVAFKTFLRTLLHLDYVHLDLKDSFHTEGFFRRESSLFKQLVPPPQS